MLDAAASQTDWGGPAWGELWERLYHQDSVAPASYAAIPALARIATGRPDVAVDPALFLVANIIGSTDGPREQPALRVDHADWIAILQPLARRKLDFATDPREFLYALQNVALLEDLGVWPGLLGGLANEELELDCPSCGDHVFLEVIGDTIVATLESGSLAKGFPIAPPSSSDLADSGAVLVELARAHGQTSIQRQLFQLCGRFTCPACGKQQPIEGPLA